MIPSQEHLIAIMGDRLTDEWRPAFTATPRELFVSHRALCVYDKKVKTPIDRAADPDAWRSAVYSDDFIITQLDDGAGDGEGDATSSTSMPSIMLAMLNHLDAHQGQRVLEIGTGTGYNAALLAHRLGAGTQSGQGKSERHGGHRRRRGGLPTARPLRPDHCDLFGRHRAVGMGGADPARWCDRHAVGPADSQRSPTPPGSWP